MVTPLAPGVPGRNRWAPVALVAFLSALSDAVGARLAYFVPLEPAGASAHSRSDESMSTSELSSLDTVARQWLAGAQGKTVRLTIAGGGLVDIAAVRGNSGEPRGALLVARAAGSIGDLGSAATAEVELGAELMSTVLDTPPASTARQALVDWASAQPGGRAAFAISIDRLGVTNEVLGYRAGDLILRTLVARLERWAGPAGRIVRAGGARYLAIRTDLVTTTDAVHAAKRLRALIAEPVQFDGLGVSRSASVGVAIDPDGSLAPVVLLANAMRSGAAARASGGDGVYQYDDTSATARLNGLRLELELSDALIGGQLRVHYQPEYHLRTGRIVAVEALLRWQHPQLGLLAAEAFVPNSEQTHTFAAVQQWVIDETCRQLAEWTRTGAPNDLVLRVNVSAPLVVDGDITDVLFAALDRHHLAGHQVCIEITERRMPADLPGLALELDRWRERGLAVAIDDFGTGDGTLSHLLVLPVDVLKVDQSFVGAMLADERAAAIVAGVVSLARALHLDTVAEGVSGPETAAALVALGCERGQGNALGEAMPPDRLDDLLRAQVGTESP